MAVNKMGAQTGAAVLPMTSDMRHKLVMTSFCGQKRYSARSPLDSLYEFGKHLNQASQLHEGLQHDPDVWKQTKMPIYWVICLILKHQLQDILRRPLLM